MTTGEPQPHAAALPAWVPAGAAPPAAAARAGSATRRLDLDRAKGIAMLLVVFGHLIAGRTPPGADWYDWTRYAIYRFHMPFFLYLSGYVAMLTGAMLTPPAAWGSLVRRRAMRLLLPFLLVGLLILVGKMVAAQFLHVDDPPDGLLAGLVEMLVWTENSPATMIWYLSVLFICSLVTPPLLWLGIGTGGLVLLGVALQFVALPAFAYLDRFGTHFLFFAIGCWVAQREAPSLAAFDRWLPLWWALLALVLALALAQWITPWWALALGGAAGIPALHGLVRRWPIDRASWPLFVGRYSMAIYLFNTIAIGLAKALLIKAGVPWRDSGLWVHLPLLMAAGVFVPVLLKVMVLRRIPQLDRMTD